MNLAAAKPLTGQRVLVVDDQKFIRGIISTGLKGFGAEVVEASDGFEALTVLGLNDTVSGGNLEALKRQRPDMFQVGRHAHKPFDCVVSDIRMLPMNGLEMLKAVRSGMTSARRDMPVVIMSAHSDEALIGAAIALDAHGFVAKPVSQKEVSDRILRAQKMTVQLKAANIYQMLIIPELDTSTIETDVGRMAENIVAVIRAGDVAAIAGTVMTVRWDALIVGDTLSDNFTTKSGRLIAPAGTKVSDVLLHALRDLSQVAELSDEISIRRKPPPPPPGAPGR